MKYDSERVSELEGTSRPEINSQKGYRSSAFQCQFYFQTLNPDNGWTLSFVESSAVGIECVCSD